MRPWSLQKMLQWVENVFVLYTPFPCITIEDLEMNYSTIVTICIHFHIMDTRTDSSSITLAGTDWCVSSERDREALNLNGTSAHTLWRSM